MLFEINLYNSNFTCLTEHYTRRVLRPRTEPKSYAEAPDIVLLPAKINGKQQNGNIDSDTDDEEMPAIIAIKVISLLLLQQIFLLF